MAQNIRRNAASGKVLSVTEAAYVAGMIDGEGTISIVTHKTKTRRGQAFVANVCIANTDLPLLESLVETMGNGQIDVCGQLFSNHKTGYKLRLSIMQVRHILPQIRPYLRLKARQADLVIEYFALQDRGRLGGHVGVSDDDWPRAIELFREMRALNQRGPLREDPDFEVRERKPIEKRPCAVDACDDRAYRSEAWCYKHWMEFGDHAERACEWCGKAFKSGRAGTRFCSDACGNTSYRHRMTGGKKREYRKLTEETVRQIVADFQAGQRCLTTLGEKHGCNRSNVRSILVGNTWKHLGLNLPDPALIGDVTGGQHWTARKPRAHISDE